MARIPGLGKLRRAARRLGRLATSKGLVLMYHRVADVERDPWEMVVSPRHFEEHLDVLRRLDAVVPLRELRAGLTRSRQPRVAVTFDDGYADNLQVALPLLQRFEVPAAVFVATAHLDGGAFWWDVLEERVLGPHVLPDGVRVDGADVPIPAPARTASAVPAGWRADDEPAPGPREALFLDLHARLERAPAARGQALAALGDAMPRAARSLRRDELAELARCPLVEVGAHTASHARLTALSAGARRREIGAGRDALVAATGAPVVRFSYPHGDVDDATAADVREAGFVEACTSRQDVVLARTDPLRIPRVAVSSCDGEAFERFLRRWLRG